MPTPPDAPTPSLDAERGGTTALRLKRAGEKAAVLADLLETERRGSDVRIGETYVRFLPGGAPGRPQLHGELFT